MTIDKEKKGIRYRLADSNIEMYPVSVEACIFDDRADEDILNKWLQCIEKLLRGI